MATSWKIWEILPSFNLWFNVYLFYHTNVLCEAFSSTSASSKSTKVLLQQYVPLVDVKTLA